MPISARCAHVSGSRTCSCWQRPGGGRSAHGRRSARYSPGLRRLLPGLVLGVPRQRRVRPRGRPAASGQAEPADRGWTRFPSPFALTLAVVLAGAGTRVSLAHRWQLGVLVAAYVVSQVAYSLWLKHEPVLDLAIVTSGFVMRAVAGGLAAGLAISDWFLLVAGFGALFVVAGKRYSELHVLGSEAGTRRSLVRYTSTYLRFVWSIAASVTLVGYSLWAFEQTARVGRVRGRRSRSSRSSWRCCATPSTSTPAWRPSPRTSCGATTGCRCVGLVWLTLVCLGVAWLIRDRRGEARLLTGWGRTAPTASRGRDGRRRRRRQR